MTAYIYRGEIIVLVSGKRLVTRSQQREYSCLLSTEESSDVWMDTDVLLKSVSTQLSSSTTLI